MMRPIPLIRGANHAPQALLTARARQLAVEGLDQESIIAALASEYPGLPTENHYANPAAIAVIERIRGRQRDAQRLEAHNAWRRAKGMPELATEDEETAEPDAGELAAVISGRELLRLCKRYDLALGFDESNRSLRLSRPIDTTGPLAAAIRQHRSSLVKILSPLRTAL